jgi:soluble cytochrome b562
MAGIFDGEEFGKTIVEAVNASIDRQLAPLLRRLDALEASTVADDMKSVRTDLRSIMETVGAIPVIKDDAIRALITEEVRDIRGALESTLMPEMQVALSVMVKEAVATIPVPVAPELPDISVMVKEAVATIPVPVAPELPDIAAMVDDAVKALPPARDGKDADPIDMEAVKALVVDAVAGVELPELPDIAGMVTEAVGKAVSELPPARDGKDADPIDMDAVKTILIEAVAALPPAKDGKDADPVDMDGVYRRVDEVLATGLDEYKKSVDNIRIPEDGKSVTIDDVRPLIDDAVSKAVAALPPARDGKDGADVMDAVIDRIGHLVLTFSNGKTKDVGQVVGDDGVDCDFDGVWKLINEKLDSWPKPKDGMGFDDLSVEYDGERTFKFVLSQGDRKKEFAFDVPIVLDRGIYADGKSYARGDAVTWDGSSWIAQTDGAKEKPGTGKEWRLAIKRGTRGKDGVMTVPKAPAPVMLGGR